MSDNSYTTVSNQSWFSRLGDAFKGVLIGLLLFVVAIPLIVINEKRSIDTLKGLAQAESVLVALSEPDVRTENEGKLVHFSADMATNDTLSDPVFGGSYNVVVLQRQVEMYQWSEQKESKKQKKLGGGTETINTYRYNGTWSGEQIDSSQFNRSGEYHNPPLLYSNSTWTASGVTAGSFDVPDMLLLKLKDFQEVQPRESDLTIPPGFSLQGGWLSSGDISNPDIGDVRISFALIPAGPVSILAQQKGNTLTSFQTRTGTRVAMIKPGNLAPAAMISSAKSDNAAITWLLRIGGFMLMFIGALLVLNPLKVFADVIPFLGTLVGVGTGIVAGLFALAAASLVTALAWIAVRPMVGAGLLVIVIGTLYFLNRLRLQRAPVPSRETEGA